MKKLLLSAFLSIISIAHLNACDCSGPDNFCESISHNEHVALVKVLSHTDDYMTISIIENIRNSFSNSQITVVGQNGFNCSEWLEQFIESDTLVLGLQDFGMTDTFNLSLCGVYYLHYQNGNVSGDISPSSTIQSYEGFKANFDQCSSNSVFEEEAEVNFHSYLTNQQLHVFSERENLREVSVYDISGSLLLKQITVGNTRFNTDISSLSAGTYLIEIISDKSRILNKLIKHD
jgi:hypothetical protein